MRAYTQPPMRRLHVLFLNAADSLGADVAVHVSLARTLDRSKVRVSAATNLRESAGASPMAAFSAIPDMTVLPLDLGQPLGSRHGLGLAKAMLYNARGAATLVRLAAWCRQNRVDLIHVTERPRQTLFGLFVARLAGCACLVHAHTGVYPQEATRFGRWRLNAAEAVVAFRGSPPPATYNSRRCPPTECSRSTTRLMRTSSGRILPPRDVDVCAPVWDCRTMPR